MDDQDFLNENLELDNLASFSGEFYPDVEEGDFSNEALGLDNLASFSENVCPDVDDREPPECLEKIWITVRGTSEDEIRVDIYASDRKMCINVNDSKLSDIFKAECLTFRSLKLLRGNSTVTYSELKNEDEIIVVFEGNEH